MVQFGTDAHVTPWLGKCLTGTTVESCRAERIKSGPEREVWNCTFAVDGQDLGAVLSIFKPGSLETVNASLPPEETASKCALAMTKLPSLGIPAPRVLGYATAEGQAALLCEKVDKMTWQENTRPEAARVLARIHGLRETDLSEELRELVRVSDPREYRTTDGQAPPCESKTLVHGDYFSVNILCAGSGLCIIDWETFGWGDPMWDLGFLTGADRDLPREEILATIAAYEECAPVDRDRLAWHQRRWVEFWMKRDQRLKQRLQSERQGKCDCG